MHVHARTHARTHPTHPNSLTALPRVSLPPTYIPTLFRVSFSLPHCPPPTHTYTHSKNAWVRTAANIWRISSKGTQSPLFHELPLTHSALPSPHPCPPPPPSPPSGGSRQALRPLFCLPHPPALPHPLQKPRGRHCRLSGVAMATGPRPSSPWGWAEDPASQTDKGVPVTVATVAGLSSQLLEGRSE